MAESITLSEQSGVRYLHFGSEWIQGAMRIRRPNELELAYTREMMLPLLFHNPPWPRRILMIGLGAGSLAKFILQALPESHLQVVEINPDVPVVARSHFRLPEEDRRFRIIVEDGVDYVERTRHRFDWILVDGYDRHARSGPLDQAPFYAACRSRLTDNGMLTTNLFQRARGHQASIARLAASFERRAIAIASADVGNVIGVAATGPALEVDLGELRARADALRASGRLDLRPAITRLQLSVPLEGEALRL
jgi:spermidine synthase